LDTAAPMRLRRVMMPLVTAIADSIMSSGRAAASEHPGALAFGERLIPFFSVVDTDRFANSPAKRHEARARLGIDDSTLVVGNVNNINLIKGHDLFVEAAGALHQIRPQTQFVILGTQSEHHAEYVSGLWRRAAQLGLDLGTDLIVVDPGTEVADLAAAFDVFWLTSPPRSEGVSTVVGEAMSLEIPVVATRVGSVPESVADGVTGTLVRPLDAHALVEGTLPYLDDPRLRMTVGAAGRQRAQQLYSAEACASRHEEAFRLAVRHRAARGTGILRRRAA
jgi:glycosyltransferase involved in cell wall biosynthesis